MVSHFSQDSFLVEGILVIIFENSPCNSVHSSATVHVLIGVDMFPELIILHYSVLYTLCRTKTENNITVILMAIGRFGADKIYSQFMHLHDLDLLLN